MKVFGHLELSQDFADFHADRPGAGDPARGDRGDDRCQGGFGRGEQVGAFAGAFGGKERVTARHEAFARVVGMGDLGEVLIVEQRHLQRPVIGGQRGDGRGAQRESASPSHRAP